MNKVTKSVSLYKLNIAPIIFVNFFFSLVLVSCDNNGGFGPDFHSVKIRQNVGGFLVCNAEHEADIHNYWWTVDYVYEALNNKSYDIGSGTYFDRNWEKNEQLISFENWLILKTGNDYNSDKLIIGDLNKNMWKEYKISPDSIEKERLWKSKNIDSQLGSQPSESFVKDISKKGKVTVVYKYSRKNRIFYKSAEKLIIYQIDSTTGIPVITGISEL